MMHELVEYNGKEYLLEYIDEDQRWAQIEAIAKKS